MATSANEIISFTLESDTRQVTNDLTKAEQVAQNITDGLKKSYDAIETKSAQTVKNISKGIVEMRKKSAEELKSSLSGFTQWFEANFGTIQKMFPLLTDMSKKLYEGIARSSEVIKTSFQQMFRSVQEISVAATRGVLDSARETAQRALNSEFLLALRKSVSSMTDYIKEKTEPVQKLFVGTWKLAEVSLNALKFTAFGTVELLGRMGAKTVQLAKGFGKRFNQMKENVKGVLRVATGYIKSVANAIQSTIKWGAQLSGMNTLMRGIKKAAKFTVAVTGVTAAVAGVRSIFSTAREGGGAALEVLSSTVKSVFAPLENALYQLAVQALPTIIELLRPFVNLALQGVEALMQMFETTNQQGSAMSNIFNQLKSVADSLVGAFSEIGGILVTSVFPVLGAAITTVLKEMVSLVTFVAPVVTDLMAAILPAVGRLIKVLVPVLGALARAVSVVFQGIAQAIKDVLPDIVGVIEDSIPVLQPMFEGLIVSLGKFVKVLAPMLAGLAKFTVLVLTKIVGPVLIKGLTIAVDFIGFLLSGVAELVAFLAIKFGPTFEGAFKFMKSFGTGVVNFFNNIVLGSVQAVLNTLKGAWQWVKDIFSIDNTLKDSGIFNALSSVITGSFGVLKKMFSGIISIVNYILSYFTDYQIEGFGDDGSVIDGSKAAKPDTGAGGNMAEEAKGALKYGGQFRGDFISIKPSKSEQLLAQKNSMITRKQFEEMNENMRVMKEMQLKQQQSGLERGGVVDPNRNIGKRGFGDF